MRKVPLASPDDETEARVFRGLSDPLETENVALNYFERAPGESIGDCYHRHHEQEELFVVLSGTATFDTEDGPVVVESGECVRFAPGEWQQGWNRGADRLVVLALGAPRETGPTDLRRECSSCDERTPVRVEEGATEVVFYCAECGEETGRYD
ncbi:cupin domain-containing protein [Halogeometricum limi]|uniref:Mannose-6-phosphate isomerase, cupin superfamily n=1 Tax=Halogeometricum limi TaxID=555875 RepID=A0A1I6GZN5_9EURY|nr:cupin domain-containing protein [Halogeometricum limi]SFR47577.1 Mannose-6-phosphate isomerase, cupin superfamily [Halogeometricum limi]